jgi:hypothetical protein
LICTDARQNSATCGENQDFSKKDDLQVPIKAIDEKYIFPCEGRWIARGVFSIDLISQKVSIDQF